MDLLYIKTLFNDGKYQEVLDYLQPLDEQKQKLSIELNKRIECLVFKSRSLERIDQDKEALKISSQLIALISGQVNRDVKLGIIVAHLYLLFKMKDIEKAVIIITEGDIILDSLSNIEKAKGAYWISQYLNLKAIITSIKSRDYKTLELFLEGLKFAELDGSLDLIANLLNNIGHFYVEIGEINSAIEYFTRSLKIDESLRNPERTHFLFGNLGRLYRIIGNLDLSKEYFERSLTSIKSIGNNDMVTEALFQIFLTDLEQENPSQAQKYLILIQNLFDQTQSNNVRIISLLSQALFLKKNIRASKKFQALDILRDIINEKNIDNEYRTLAISHLCELLLVEYRSFGEAVVLQEIKYSINEFEKIAKISQSFILKVEILVLKAKFALIEGKFQQALKYMDQASIETEEKGHKLLMKKILHEKAQFETDYEKTVNLVQRTGSIHKQLEIAQIETYLKEVRKAIQLLKKTI